MTTRQRPLDLLDESLRCDPSMIRSEPPGACLVLRIGATLVPVPAASTTESSAATMKNTETG